MRETYDNYTLLSGTHAGNSVVHEDQGTSRAMQDDAFGGVKEALYGPSGGTLSALIGSDPATVAPASEDDGIEITEVAIAQRFIAAHKHELRWCREWNCWLVWDGRRWRCDADGLVTRWVIELGKSLYVHAGDFDRDAERDAFLKEVKRTQMRRFISAVLTLARDLEGVTVSSADLDSCPYLLNVANGVVDLRNGDLFKHDPDMLLTKLIPYDYEPDAKAPIFDAFMAKIQPNEATRDYLRRWAGYSATGFTTERRMVVWYGGGRNGKSTLRETLDELLGEHARVAPAELIVGRRDGTHPTDLAGLMGKRAVTASETDKGRPLASGLVKQMTGGDTVTARLMRQDYVDFVPQFKITLLTNHRPKMDSTDQAIWDRVDLVPFSVRISDDELDRDLREKLRSEFPGILTYVVRGAVEWFKRGLGSAPEVQNATQVYRAESDSVGAFVGSSCILGAGLEVSSSNLYEAYKGWCSEEGTTPLSLSDFTERLVSRELQKPVRASAGPNKGRNVWRGIALADVQEPSEAA